MFNDSQLLDWEKTQALIVYLANKCELGKTKLMKLLYFIDFSHFEKHGESVTNSVYYHWQYGPVPTAVYGQLEELSILKSDTNEQKLFSQENELILEGVNIHRIIPYYDVKISTVFNREELQTIHDVLLMYGEKNASDLTRESHETKPYQMTKSNEMIPYYLVHYKNWNKPSASEIFTPDVLAELNIVDENSNFVNREFIKINTELCAH